MTITCRVLMLYPKFVPNSFWNYTEACKLVGAKYPAAPLGLITVAAMLPSGNVLFQLSWTRIVEMDLKTDKIVWEYDSAKRNGNEGNPVEVHAFQRLADGNTMIAESGPGRIIEVDKTGASYYGKQQLHFMSCGGDTAMVQLAKEGPIYSVGRSDNNILESYCLSVISRFHASRKVIWV